DLRYFDFLKRHRMFSDRLVELFGRPPRAPEGGIEGFHQDVARSLQVVLEEILLEKAAYLHGRVGGEAPCLAGGGAANCVRDSRVAREGPFKRIFVRPAASDAGGALGAAAAAWVHLTGSPLRQRGLPHVYLGPGFTPEDVHELFAATPVRAHDYRGREDDLLR